MKITVDFEECLKDSPRFRLRLPGHAPRATIEEVEGDVCELESKLDKLVKLCIGMIDAGKAYNAANKQFVSGIRELAQQSTKDEVIESSLTKFAESLQEMINYHTINVLQSKRRSEILKSMLSFMYAHLTFFHQGYDLFSELQPLMKQLGGQLDQLVVDAAKEKRDMEQKHSTIQQKEVTELHSLPDYRNFCAWRSSSDFSNDDTKLEYNVDADNGIAMEGYLFKRASNAFKTWNRRWFSIQNNQLVYQKKFKDNPTVVVEDLRLCTVKHCEDIERRFCFEVVSPTKSLGVHFSKVRSLTLDTWEPELLKLMCELGNKVINQIYEARREELGARKPQPGDPRHEVEAYIKAKYVDRRFVRRPSDEELRTKVVSLSKQEKRLSSSSEHLPPRAPPPTPKLRPGSNVSGQSAVASGLEARRDSLFCPDELDSLFSYFDTSSKLRSNAAETPPMPMPATLPPPSPCKEMVFYEPKEYSPGLQLYWASLRLAKMNEEMREAEGPYSQSGDETYQDIFQDFTHMASNDPDKLNRYQQYDPQRP
eukprot:superscaffoldBa00002912_g15628